MSRGLLIVEPGISLQEAARQMDERHVGAALVLEGDVLREIVTERTSSGLSRPAPSKASSSRIG
jgi:hypothetical protein